MAEERETLLRMKLDVRMDGPIGGVRCRTDCEVFKAFKVCPLSRSGVTAPGPACPRAGAVEVILDSVMGEERRGGGSDAK